ncbi:hypothetical protein CEXT_156281 [Caerostris extrusa]|uniref:Uncharacterized protein n=1 Tax=Caerostris extrusa TaxID=172846 RepID=A0AAV4Y484_CAEEX|nr:hypothetical protein CEXT_156281 [Caerostris extrusa]
MDDSLAKDQVSIFISLYLCVIFNFQSATFRFLITRSSNGRNCVRGWRRGGVRNGKVLSAEDLSTQTKQNAKTRRDTHRLRQRLRWKAAAHVVLEWRFHLLPLPPGNAISTFLRIPLFVLKPPGQGVIFFGLSAFDGAIFIFSHFSSRSREEKCQIFLFDFDGTKTERC